MSDRPIDNKCSACGDDCMDTEACFNSGDWCIECCIKAGDPCGHADGPDVDADEEMEAGGWTDPDMEPDDEPEWHTYATVLQFSARSDEHAREIAAKFKELIEAWHEFIERDLPEEEQVTMQPQGYVIEAAHVVDADDWAESLGQEDVCFDCGRSGGTNRSRNGTGSRVCPSCIEAGRYPAYRIEEALI